MFDISNRNSNNNNMAFKIDSFIPQYSFSAMKVLRNI